MLTEPARVIRAMEGYAWVEVERKTACGSCSANKSCGSGILARVFSSRPLQLKVENPLSAATGDEVLVAIDDGVLVKGSLMAYTFPLLLMIAGALLGESLQPLIAGQGGEGITILFGFMGLAAGCYGLKCYARSLAKRHKYQARIIELTRASGFPHWTIHKE